MQIKFENSQAIYEFIRDYIQSDISTMDMDVLIEEVEKLNPGDTYLEVGVSEGSSFATAYFTAKDGVNIVGVDILNQPRRQQLFEAVDLNTNGLFVYGDSVNLAKVWGSKINVIFIDGDHSYEGCKRDIEAWLPHMAETGVMLFHDYDITSPGVIEAVDELFKDKVERIWTDEKRTSIVRIRL